MKISPRSEANFITQYWQDRFYNKYQQKKKKFDEKNGLEEVAEEQ
jgi:hypothetical protein